VVSDQNIKLLLLRYLQHVATAAAINIDRIVAWLEERPRATTRTSRFAALAPVHDLPSETPSI
jgi:hypothetical protein